MKGRIYVLKKNKFLIFTLVIALLVVGCSSKEENKPWELEDISKAIDETAELILDLIEEPTMDSVGGEWTIMGLARSGRQVPENYYEDYYKRLEEIVAESEGILHKKKYTEYSRVILALTAIGKDPMDVSGYDLTKELGDFDAVIFQGINGPTFALLALDSANYELPVNSNAKVQATREAYIEEILSRELDGGGFTLGTDSDEINIDITGMVLQALAKYKDSQDVGQAIDRALDKLSQEQLETGGFSFYGVESSESIVQVIMALNELGVDINDTRFIKNSNSLLSRLMDFYVEGGGFVHVLPDGENNGGAMPGELDLMATDQGFYALVSTERILKGQSSFYRMED